ncbi:MAG: hypothetical protein IT286_02305 [Proteobacteria bacterium]|jgi:hypothetical protein|nr:hypothetical protein [Pseudomonadota bacterium]
MNSFWSKGRNRAVVYAVGFLILFGSYVIGAPESGRPRQKSPKRTKLEASVSSSNETQFEPSMETVEEFDQPVSSDPITPQTVAIAPSTGAAPSTSLSGYDSTYPATMYDPIHERDVSESMEKAVEKEMERPATQYPYEVSDEELQLAKQASQRELTPEEKEKQLGFALSFGKYRKPPVAQVTPKNNSNESGSGLSTASKRSYPTTSSYYSRALGVSNENKSEEAIKGEEKAGYRQGTVEEEERVQYLNPSFFSIPEAWNITHEFLEVYEFNPGVNAGVIPAAWGKKGSNLFSKVGPEQNKQLHDKYRIPPDWDNRYKFSDNQDEEVRLSTIASNKHLLSLGTNGAVTFIVRDGRLVNGEGADFVIWSHPFCFIKTEKTVQEMNDGSRANYQKYMPRSNRAISGIENGVQCQTELARVYVSNEGPNGEWIPIEPCQKGSDPMNSRCAGYGMNLWNQTPTPFSPLSGGDRYDLGDLGLAEINAIKITDLSNVGEFQKGGFDLDAIAMIHFLKTTQGSKSK